MKTKLIQDIIEHKLFQVALTSDNWILLKNGTRAPLFLDTSKFIAYPQLIARVNKLAIKTIKDNQLVFNQIMGAPYGGLPFAYGIANTLKTPCVALRKEGPKSYGTAAELLGVYKQGDRILIIEDATVTANTVIEFVEKIRTKGLRVTDVITILDISKDASNNLKKHQVKLHALFTWKELYNYYKLKNIHLISKEMQITLDKLVGN